MTLIVNGIIATAGSIQEEMNLLVDQINFHNYRYYELNDPLISDQDYDQMYQRLETLEKQYPQFAREDSPTKRVSGFVSKQFQPAPHAIPMLSLKTETDYSDQGARDFYQRIKKELNHPAVEFYSEPKFDGLGIDLIYENGVLTRGSTRGDGFTGEDVTINVCQIKDIPRYLNPIPNLQFKRINIRGEALMRKDVFAKLNEELEAKGEKKFVNPRNAAAGSIRQLNAEVTKQRQLNFFPYSVVDFTLSQGGSQDLPQTQAEWIRLLHLLGFTVCEYNELMSSMEELVEYHNKLEALREVLPYEIDGVVYKVNRLIYQERLGYISREPRWAIAHKFLAEEKITKVLAIDVQVGRTGKLTPVARLEPVFVGGATVTNVTLHNESEVHRKDIRVGDHVVVRRAGDVIPEIVKTVVAEDQERNEPFRMPSVCPECNSVLLRELDQADYRCTGKRICPAQAKNGLLHAVQRKALNIDGFGDKLIEQLMDAGLLTNLVDIYCLGARKEAEQQGYSLTEFIKETDSIKRYQLAMDSLLSLDRMAIKSATNILTAIAESKMTTLARFIYALGIRNVGESMAKDLAKHFQSLDNLKTATYDDLIKIPDVGPGVAESVVNYFQDENNLEMIYQLQLLGLQFEIIKPVTTTPQLEGLTVVITGNFGEITRDWIKARLEELGAKVTGSVSKSTKLLLVGQEPGKGKLDDATKFSVPKLELTGSQITDLFNHPETLTRYIDK